MPRHGVPRLPRCRRSGPHEVVDVEVASLEVGDGVLAPQVKGAVGTIHVGKALLEGVLKGRCLGYVGAICGCPA